MLLENHSTSGESGNFQIQNSLRFQSASSQYLTRTFTSSATWCFSAWVKRGALGSISPILGDTIKFLANDTLTADGLTTTAVYRDPASWYHIFMNNTGLYINGSLIGSTTTSSLSSPKIGSNGTNYFDGYITEIHFVDGTSLPVSTFGTTDTTSGQWIANPYNGSHGTNGFYLPFSNGTSTTTLGNDSSGNGNNWTLTNFTRSAGVSDCWMTDVPSGNGGASGTQPSSNYATLNPVSYLTPTLANANLQSTDTSTQRITQSTIGMTSGKWYWEVIQTGGASPMIGICTAQISPTVSYLGQSPYGWGYANNALKWNNGSSTAYGATYTTGDVIGVAFDADNGTLTFYKNNVSQGTAFTGLTSGPYFASSGNNTGLVLAWNFGQRSFQYSPPSGFKSLCTANLP